MVAVAVAVGFAPLASPRALAAQQEQEDEERELGWSLAAELSSVFTSGNQAARTIGAGATLEWYGERAGFRVKAGLVFQESGLTTRRAVGSVDSYVLEEDTRLERTAESYSVRTRYDFGVSDRTYVFGALDWLRDTFAGIESQVVLAAGAGTRWVDREEFTFRTDYAVTYALRKDVIGAPEADETFPGLRLGYELARSLTSSTDFESELVADWNLSNTDDVQVDWINALPVSISERLSLKPSLRLLWRNEPALTEVDVYTPGGVPTGETVLAPLEKLDSYFHLALVVTL